MMDLLVRTGTFDRVYNCTADEGSRQSVEDGRNAFVAAVLFVLWIGFQVLYLPCLRVIYIGRTRYACFQFMYYIGLLDLGALHISTGFTAFLLLNGWAFCTSPRLIFTLGSLSMGFWLTQCFLAILLAVCRCLEVFAPQRAESLFGGANGRLWVLLAVFYGLLGCWCTRPLVYNHHYSAWIPDPFIDVGQESTPLFDNPFYRLHNIVFVVLILSLYIVFAVISGVRIKSLKKRGKLKFNNAQKRSFIQVAIISLINTTGAATSTYLESTPDSRQLAFGASLMLVFVHGAPAIAYLTINKTIRNGCQRIIRRAQLQSVAIIPMQTVAKTSADGENSIAGQLPPLGRRCL